MSMEKLPEPFSTAISAMRTLVDRPHWMRASDAINVLDVMIGNLGARLEPSSEFGIAAEAVKTAVQELAARSAGQQDGKDVETARQTCRAKIDDLADVLQSVQPKVLG